MKKRTMLTPELTDRARRIVVELEDFGVSESPTSDAVWIGFQWEGTPCYVWLGSWGVKQLRRRVPPSKIFGAKVPLFLRRVKNPRTGALVDRYYISRESGAWDKVEPGEGQK